MINRKLFYDGVRNRPFPKKLTTGQVSGMEYILDEWEERKLTDLRWLAYMLATTKWETTHTMQPVREGGGIAYLKTKKYYPWFGRGLVQITWEMNYQKFRQRVLDTFGLDIILKPDDALDIEVAVYILFEGMINGEFTGKKLSDYFNAAKTDWINARRIVNGVDKAQDIAGIAKQFYADLIVANGDSK